MVHPNELIRRRLACELVGKGIEIGPGCHPLALGPAARSIEYVDRFDRAGFVSVFPECQAEMEGFPSRVTLMDVTRESLVERWKAGSLDFVVLNHVLEHIVDPIRLLKEVHGVLREGGILYLAVPDKRFMFDRFRRRTRLSELIHRHHERWAEPSDEMIVEFIEQAEQLDRPLDLKLPADARRVADHRRRSIHANVWVVEDLLELFGYLSREGMAAWELLDGIVTPTETILLLCGVADASGWERSDRVMNRIWYDSQTALMEREIKRDLATIERTTLDAHDRLLRLDERARETQNFVRRIKRMLERLPLIKGWVNE
jgi:SAM-dependent methyltransferase